MSKQQAPLQRTGVLLERVDGAGEKLLSKFSEIVSMSSNSGKDNSTIATENFHIEANASTMVRAAEDLLFVTRSLKESWILGQVRPLAKDHDSAEKRQEDAKKSNVLLDVALNGGSDKD